MEIAYGKHAHVKVRSFKGEQNMIEKNNQSINPESAAADTITRISLLDILQELSIRSEVSVLQLLQEIQKMFSYANMCSSFTFYLHSLVTLVTRWKHQ